MLFTVVLYFVLALQRGNTFGDMHHISNFKAVLNEWYLISDLPPEVREELEAKLEKFGDILEKEVVIMEKQHYLMVTGKLGKRVYK